MLVYLLVNCRIRSQSGIVQMSAVLKRSVLSVEDKLIVSHHPSHVKRCFLLECSFVKSDILHVVY